MVFGGVMPYIPQYLQIQSKQTTQGFSMFVCLALLMANTLRIIFWFGNHFETPLLIQSILMNLTMFALIHLCVKINNKEYIAEKRKGRHFTDFDPDYFWRWTDFLSYLEFVMCIALFGKNTYNPTIRKIQNPRIVRICFDVFAVGLSLVC